MQDIKITRLNKRAKLGSYETGVDENYSPIETFVEHATVWCAELAMTYKEVITNAGGVRKGYKTIAIRHFPNLDKQWVVMLDDETYTIETISQESGIHGFDILDLKLKKD